ncbi:hypothetical protein XH89_15175 [Bradyrhizobium sp. CCBAU 53340]|uniref:hypothetical protein n=1 Tax=Bradyrhizobium sp. CCBAU 53340 TaxID=1325112 RepID=UPI00188A3353|nr:hypothetical protein [Bradyrhizobium sp. CCBAU 53340]QOZ44669.1 hypothetical protein XH89_15175 [Bradyrhizobium sp. CCBAU 53340]
MFVGPCVVDPLSALIMQIRQTAEISTRRHVDGLFEIDAPIEAIRPRGDVSVRIRRGETEINSFQAIAAIETSLECEILRVGGLLPLILRRTLTREDWWATASSTGGRTLVNYSCVGPWLRTQGEVGTPPLSATIACG